MRSRCLVMLGLGRRQNNFLTDLKGTSWMNLLRSSGTWRVEAEAAQVTDTPVSTAQHCIPRSLNPEIQSDVCVSLEEKNDENKMDPEPTEHESPSAGTGIETSGQQCPPNEGTWKTGRTNHRRRLFARWHGFKSGGRHLFTDGTRWYASRYSYDTGKFIKHHLPEGKPQTKGQDTQRRKQAI